MEDLTAEEITEAVEAPVDDLTLIMVAIMVNIMVAITEVIMVAITEDIMVDPIAEVVQILEEEATTEGITVEAATVDTTVVRAVLASTTPGLTAAAVGLTTTNHLVAEPPYRPTSSFT